MSKIANHFLLSGGRFVYPSLAAPNDDAEYGTGKYECGYLIPKEDWKTEKYKPLKLAVFKIAKEHFKKKDIKKLSDFKHPFRDGDEIADEKGYEYMRGHIWITGRSPNAVTVVGPDKQKMDSKDIEAIKSGDHGNIFVNPYYYHQQGGGVTVGLQLVQFWKEGEAFGRSDNALIDELEELEVLDAVDEEELEEEELEEEELEEEELEEEETPKPKKTTKKKAAGKKKTVAKKKAPIESDEDDYVDLDSL